jgi:hypothetical protein
MGRVCTRRWDESPKIGGDATLPWIGVTLGFERP